MPCVLESGRISYFESLVRLIPSLIWLFLVFFVFLFEYYLNFFAEVTRFGDREFYQVKLISFDFKVFHNRIGGILQAGMSGPENGISLFMNIYIDMYT